MHSITASPAYMLFSHYSVADLNSHSFPSIFFVVDSRRRRRVQPQHFAALNLVAVKETGSVLACSESFKKGVSFRGLYWGCSGFLRRCKEWESDGDFSLEAEILEFMKNSKKPEAFPTKKELVDAGRMDLVHAIFRKGGWLLFGWDLDENTGEGGREMNVENASSFILNELDVKDEVTEIQNEIQTSWITSSSANQSQPSMSSDRSVEKEAEESGIEGILKRLEKERSNTLELGFTEKEDSISFGNKEDNDKWLYRTTTDAEVNDNEKRSRPALLGPTRSSLSGFQSKLDQHSSLSGSDGFGNLPLPEMWRSSIIQRTGSYADFEDSEMTSSKIGKGGVTNVSGKDTLQMREFATQPIDREEEIGSLSRKANYNDINSLLQRLDLELSSVRHSLRFSADNVAKHTGQKISSDDPQNLSDAWEFQENKIINAHNRLRSLRAKLAVLEGKMALTIMDANKMVEEKQKRLDSARRALCLLKTTYVVWPNSGSEVLLAGSFDGWSTQRKMEKSSAGIFSVCLQLYPGKYEIKFIVDGEWRVDPLRPIVENNGHQNNLFIVS